MTHTDAALEGHAGCIIFHAVKLLLDKNKSELQGRK